MQGEETVREKQGRMDIDRYRREYRDNPQTEEELGWSDVAAQQHLDELPWD